MPGTPPRYRLDKDEKDDGGDGGSGGGGDAGVRSRSSRQKSFAAPRVPGGSITLSRKDDKQRRGGDGEAPAPLDLFGGATPGGSLAGSRPSPRPPVVGLSAPPLLNLGISPLGVSSPAPPLKQPDQLGYSVRHDTSMGQLGLSQPLGLHFFGSLGLPPALGAGSPLHAGFAPLPPALMALNAVPSAAASLAGWPGCWAAGGLQYHTATPSTAPSHCRLLSSISTTYAVPPGSHAAPHALGVPAARSGSVGRGLLSSSMQARESSAPPGGRSPSVPRPRVPHSQQQACLLSPAGNVRVEVAQSAPGSPRRPPLRTLYGAPLVCTSAGSAGNLQLNGDRRQATPLRPRVLSPARITKLHASEGFEQQPLQQPVQLESLQLLQKQQQQQQQQLQSPMRLQEPQQQPQQLQQQQQQLQQHHLVSMGTALHAGGSFVLSSHPQPTTMLQVMPQGQFVQQALPNMYHSGHGGYCLMQPTQVMVTAPQLHPLQYLEPPPPPICAPAFESRR